jgi:LmbE family N-acetylglucosaminyl deacetylase
MHEMPNDLRLMCVLAHPDDETLGAGSTLAKYAGDSVDTYLVTATRGERGWFGREEDDPGLEALGKIREAELRSAAEVLGICQVDFLDYIDGDLDQADPAQIIRKIVTHIRHVRPQVVITFGPDGAYGHPDHIAISQFTTAALVCAADAMYDSPHPPHRVAKLYYFATPKEEYAIYESVMGDLVMPVDGVDRRPVGWEDWAITTWIQAEDYWRTTFEAVKCHRSQLPGYGKLIELPENVHKTLWGIRTYYRAFSLVNGGRQRETDLFEGLR